jgi:hypothetical protein
MQKQIIAAFAGVWLSLALPAWSTENSQQTKMTTCNADAKTKGLTGDDRKAFMKSCLSADAPAPATGNSQQQKMKTCNADATSKGLKGDDRKTYMKTCLSSGN